MRGIPIRIELGPKDIEKNKCIVVKRNDNQKIEMEIDGNFAKNIEGLLNIIHNEMYEKAVSYLNDHITRIHTFEEFEKVLEEKKGFVQAPWCGETECELEIKEKTTATSRCITEQEVEENETCICCGKKAKHIVNFAKSY